jgi:hypothetical protein
MHVDAPVEMPRDAGSIPAARFEVRRDAFRKAIGVTEYPVPQGRGHLRFRSGWQESQEKPMLYNVTARTKTDTSRRGNGKAERNGSNARSPNRQAARSQGMGNVAEEVALETETQVRLFAREATPEWIPKVH